MTQTQNPAQSHNLVPGELLSHSAGTPVGWAAQNLENTSAAPPGATKDVLPRGTRLGIDVGKARIGVAASDPDGLMAMPVETVRRTMASASSSGISDIDQIVAIVHDRAATAIYVGLPKHMSGKEGDSARDARSFAAKLAAKLPDVELRFIDERLTTVTATANLQAAGRKANRHKSVIDQQAAVIILQSALDAERVRGLRAGSPVAPG